MVASEKESQSVNLHRGQPLPLASQQLHAYHPGSPYILSDPAPNKDKEKQTLTQQSGGAE